MNDREIFLAIAHFEKPGYVPIFGFSGAPGMSWGEKVFRTTTRREGEFEVIEAENGAITREVIDNANTYSMPAFVRYPVRDRITLRANYRDAEI